MTLKIGTRGSKLALIQAHRVQAAILKQNPDLETKIITIIYIDDYACRPTI